MNGLTYGQSARRSGTPTTWRSRSGGTRTGSSTRICVDRTAGTAATVVSFAASVCDRVIASAAIFLSSVDRRSGFITWLARSSPCIASRA